MYRFEQNYFLANAVIDSPVKVKGIETRKMAVNIYLRDNDWAYRDIPSYTIMLYADTTKVDFSSESSIREYIYKWLTDVADSHTRQSKKDRESLIMEVAIDITSIIWDRLNKEAEDSREAVDKIRGWAIDFETWWWLLTEDERDEYDYITMIETYSEIMLKWYCEKDYLVEVKLPLFTRISVRASSEEEAIKLAESGAMRMSIDKFQKAVKFESEIISI